MHCVAHRRWHERSGTVITDQRNDIGLQNHEPHAPRLEQHSLQEQPTQWCLASSATMAFHVAMRHAVDSGSNGRDHQRIMSAASGRDRVCGLTLPGD